MRTDFREERRWKLALAYNLAHAAVEWHEAGSPEERVRLGLVVRWSPPPPEDAEMVDASEGEQVEGPFRESQETDENGVDSRETGTPLDGYASDEDSDEEADKDHQDNLAPGAVLQDALEQLEQTQTTSGRAVGSNDVALKPKVEEVEDLVALGASTSTNAMDVDSTKTAAVKPTTSSATAPQTGEGTNGLKSTSKNPVLGGSGKDGEGSHGKSVKSKVSQYASVRENIVYSDFDKLFIDWDDLDIVKGMADLSTEDLFAPSSSNPAPHDLMAIFPDLHVYDMLDLAPTPNTEGKKKSEKKADKDDPNRRMDETTYNRLALTSRFIAVKPTLVGTLQPANHFKDGQWSRIEEARVFLDTDVVHPKEDNQCCMFHVLADRLHTFSNALQPSSSPKVLHPGQVLTSPFPFGTCESVTLSMKVWPGRLPRTPFSNKSQNDIQITGHLSPIPSTRPVLPSLRTNERPGSAQNAGLCYLKRTRQLAPRGILQRRARLHRPRHLIWLQEVINAP